MSASAGRAGSGATAELSVPPNFEAAFAAESHRLLVDRTRFLLWAAMVLYPAFWFLDLLTAPAFARQFLFIRLSVLGLYVLTMALTYTPAGQRVVRALAMGYIVASAIGISLMAALLGGFGSDYYVGNMIVLFVVGFFMPWRVADSALCCGLIVLGYLVINLLADGPSRAMISPLFFLAGTSVFVCLATLASERTRRRDLLMRLRVERANEELRELDEAKTRFFANVSHELRTPLTMILGPLEQLLQRREQQGESAERAVLAAMEANARRLLRQVNALLELAKAEAGRLRLELREGNLGRLVAEAVAAAAPQAARRGIELRAEGLEAIPDSRLDPDKVEVMIANLLSNALKFTPAGGQVVVRGGATESAVFFEVADTGPGIPPEEHERIFERFYQVDGSAAREHEGTGLGLSLTRELVRLHGGAIELESEPGRGATFRIALPRAPAEQPERRQRARRREDRMAQMRIEALAAQRLQEQSWQRTLLADVEAAPLGEAPPPPPPADPEAPRVLVVEDNPDLRTFIAYGLAEHYRVETAADGLQALECARRRRPDLIVTDVMMPRMDGHELCRQLRQQPLLASVPVVLLTARAGVEAVVEGLGCGADDYLTKPFELRELRARIEAQLRARRLERQLRERESRLAAIGQMASAIVHDLKNPLAAVVGYAELARQAALEGAAPEEIAEELAPVLSESARLRRMLQEVLDFARGGSPPLVLEPTQVASYLHEVLRPLRQELEQSGIELRCELAIDDTFAIPLDRDRVHRALENLIANAREALCSQPAPASGRRTVWVKAAVRQGGLHLRVADNGPGIPDEMADRLFEPFATAGKAQGTGLGLMTVRNLVRAHGGQVRAEPHAPEGGAAFELIFPVVAGGGGERRQPLQLSA